MQNCWRKKSFLRLHLRLVASGLTLAHTAAATTGQGGFFHNIIFFCYAVFSAIYKIFFLVLSFRKWATKNGETRSCPLQGWLRRRLRGFLKEMLKICAAVSSSIDSRFSNKAFPPRFSSERILFFDESLTAQFFQPIHIDVLLGREEKITAACVQRARPYFGDAW